MATQNREDLSLLIGAGADPQALAAFLDGLDTAGRVREVRALSRKALGELYERCKSAPPATLEEFLPSSVPVGQAVHFAGLNNLPLFRIFEKRFVRTDAGAIIGYNHQTMAPVTGPGYFTVIMGAPPKQGEVLIDYTQLPSPDQKLPAGWPAIKPNDRGLSNFVYKGMQDYMRRVSRDVFIGHATRNGEPMPNYFILARMN
jgi:hypothetical protein